MHFAAPGLTVFAALNTGSPSAIQIGEDQPAEAGQKQDEARGKRMMVDEEKEESERGKKQKRWDEQEQGQERERGGAVREG